MNKLAQSRISVMLVAGMILLLDQGSKWWMVRALRSAGSTMSLPGPVDFTLVLNRSNAFGLVPVSGDVTRWGLALLNFSVAVALGGTVIYGRTKPLAAFACAFLIAGAVGNAMDRIAFGAVVDFIDASKIGFDWVFNVADASVDVGIGLLLLAALRAGRQPRDAKA
jgi:signal peptidase II